MAAPRDPTRAQPIQRWREGSSTDDEDFVTVEEPLEIRIAGRSIAITMRTPGDDEELAAGFCLTEGIVSDPDDIVRVAHCDDEGFDNVVDVTLESSVDATDAIERAERATFLSSSCGICGKETLDRIDQAVRPFAQDLPGLSPGLISGLPIKMRRRQTIFSKTGGLHSAAVFDETGALLVLREDIGRHNAVDKVIGHCLLQRRLEHAERALLLVSGRASFEVVQKAAMGRIPVVAAVSAPSSLASDLAGRLGMTLIGFLRRGRFNIYCGNQRLHAPPLP